jgi:hypothetical protein
MLLDGAAAEMVYSHPQEKLWGRSGQGLAAVMVVWGGGQGQAACTMALTGSPPIRMLIAFGIAPPIG